MGVRRAAAGLAGNRLLMTVNKRTVNRRIVNTRCNL